MSAPASRRDDLASLVFDMEDKVRALVAWGQAVRAMGAGSSMIEPHAVSVMGTAIVECAVAVEADWERCFDLSRTPQGALMATPSTRRAALGALIALPAASLPALAAPASPELLRMVVDYEATEQARDDETERLEAVGWRESDSTWSRLCRDCGSKRAAIALHPAQSIADVMLKARALAFKLNLADDWEDLRRAIADNYGHAYDRDVAHAAMLDLARLGGFGRCA
ncbi:hypothetical protein ACRBEV_21465 [Methylobacterium phyllosphaerae]